MKSSAKKPEGKEIPSNSGKTEERSKKVKFDINSRDKDSAPTGELIWVIHWFLLIPLDYEQRYHSYDFEGTCIMCRDLKLLALAFFSFFQKMIIENAKN